MGLQHPDLHEGILSELRHRALADNVLHFRRQLRRRLWRHLVRLCRQEVGPSLQTVDLVHIDGEECLLLALHVCT